ncbi:MAG: DUF488 domain-containing protein [Bacteroidota bacterium]|nr:DUF488 domain-containing protein [Bacteroidota bacterium]
MIKIKRVYEEHDKQDGYRILVDRLWPRGVSKEAAAVDLWLKEIGPSTALRNWFSHDEKKWEGFRRKYFKELETKAQLVEQIRGLRKNERVITLLFGAKDEQHNQAVVLKEYLSDHGVK